MWYLLWLKLLGAGAAAMVKPLIHWSFDLFEYIERKFKKAPGQ